MKSETNDTAPSQSKCHDAPETDEVIGLLTMVLEQVNSMVVEDLNNARCPLL